MAASVNRICWQATRHGSKYSSRCFCQRVSVERMQCPISPASHTTPSQQRLYSHSTRLAARREQQQDDGDMAVEVFEDDIIEDLPSEADISSTGHAELEQHRELREMVRLAAWEMPLLTALAKPFNPPNKQELPLRWRYTTYFGESHPHSRKVVVTFDMEDLHQLDRKQKETLKKLCGTRYNPEKDSVRMSCESFETQAQNKRYLGDIIQKLLAEATDPAADSYEDIPLDTRHHKYKRRLRFPEEWKLSPERKQALQEKRKTLLLEEGKRVEENTVVSGIAAIEAARQLRATQVEDRPVMAEARQPLQRARTGKGGARGAQR